MNFCRRFDYAMRRVTTRKQAMRDPESIIKTVKDWHIKTRAMQMSEMNDKVWGITSPYAVFNRDQVPIALASSYAKTVSINLNYVC